MKKKSQAVIDSIVFIIMVVVFGMVCMFGYVIFSDIEPMITEDLDLNESKVIISDMNTRYPPVFDSLLALVFLGIWIAGIASAFASETHPILFGFMMIIIVFVIIAGAMLGNFYEDLFTDATLSSVVIHFPMTNWILSHMLEIGIVVSLTILLVLMGKNRL